jgi:hypothetical protein
MRLTEPYGGALSPQTQRTNFEIESQLIGRSHVVEIMTPGSVTEAREAVRRRMEASVRFRTPPYASVRLHTPPYGPYGN